MEVDCDSQQGGAGEDRRCGSRDDTQSQTTFEATVASYNAGISVPNAKVHSYVIFGNDETIPSVNP